MAGLTTLCVACGSGSSDGAREDSAAVKPLERTLRGADSPAKELPEAAPAPPTESQAPEAPVEEASPAPGKALPLEWPQSAVPLRRLLLAGTWSLESPEDFERAWLDEAGLREVFSLQPAGRRRWQGMAGGETAVNLDALTRTRPDPALAYAYSISSRPNTGNIDPLAADAFPDAEAVLHIRHACRLRAWWDGEIVLDEAAPADGQPRHVQVRVPLTDAYDVLLLKLARGADFGASMNLEVRLSDTNGEAIPRQEFVPRRKNEFPTELSGSR
ncbi:MAG: hypothetical protein DHS20C15_16270 [Planctomycetota bacterium]|nr:MAG: hypothetical protein DHS20C15_16270 [Planctomycetota bacterium]